MLPDEQQELQHLIAIISNFPLSDTEDPWRSKLDANGHFYVCKLRYLINPKLTISASNPTIWSVPLKVTSFIWRACMDRIPFSLAVIPHGVNITSSSCALCPNEFDSCDHLLVSGPYIRQILVSILKWCDVPFHTFGLVSDHRLCYQLGLVPKKEKTICSHYLWCYLVCLESEKRQDFQQVVNSSYQDGRLRYEYGLQLGTL